MCLAIPAEVVSIDAAREIAIVALGPVKKEISIALLEEVEPGDYVLVHVGFALHKRQPGGGRAHARADGARRADWMKPRWVEEPAA